MENICTSHHKGLLTSLLNTEFLGTDTKKLTEK